MSLGTGASGWWSRAMHSREGGIHGNPEVATTHLGTVTLEDSVEYLPTNHETSRPTQGRVSWAKIAKLASKRASEMSLQMIAGSAQCVMVTPSFMRPVVVGRCVWVSQSVPANHQGCKQVSCIQRLPESIASRLTLPKLHLAPWNQPDTVLKMFLKFVSEILNIIQC